MKQRKKQTASRPHFLHVIGTSRFKGSELLAWVTENRHSMESRVCGEHSWGWSRDLSFSKTTIVILVLNLKPAMYALLWDCPSPTLGFPFSNLKSHLDHCFQNGFQRTKFMKRHPGPEVNRWWIERSTVVSVTSTRRAPIWSLCMELYITFGRKTVLSL